jgi:hypothetical protein
MSTIVSAFIYEKKDNCKSFDEYYNYSKYLLECDVNKIIFLGEKMYNFIIENSIINKKNTHLICVKKEHFYLFNIIDKITNFNKHNNNNKDTLIYIITICLKTNYVNKAIELDTYNSNQFIWIDFGINHVCNIPQNTFNKYIYELSNKIYDKNIRIAGIWDINKKYNLDILTDVHWYFAGGVFGGSKEYLILFDNLMKNKCLEIINKYNTLTWEVNIWYLIWKENPHIFDIYKCNHNTSIISNY